ncbi:hypothetical protein ACNKHN_08035 [Shigella flexneri]
MAIELSTAKGTVVNFVVKYIKCLVPNMICQMPFHFVAPCTTATRMQYVKPELVPEVLSFLEYTGDHWCGEKRDADSPQYAGEP